VTVEAAALQRFLTMEPDQSVKPRPPLLAILGNFIFFSRWLQAPLYLGLIVAQGVYVYLFLKELWHLVEKAAAIDETTIMLTVLGLIDVHPDQPEWLSHVNAGVLKVKLATALIGISSVNLLKTFIEVTTRPMPDHAVMWQLLLHLTFVFSALLLAITDRISNQTAIAASLHSPKSHRASEDGNITP
jgi:uncharacterized membrane protein YqhA